ncbi:hypothetical protein E2C01_018368 [Portunus trituberculatus]|uniref:Uncharacterized protein n=1 Tax=Portunus trituberculatus TaxID=210409 RepID=A0A5B7DWN5_PORTR|nr:hypothetical protein [Portunus trituberculatus]
MLPPRDAGPDIGHEARTTAVPTPRWQQWWRQRRRRDRLQYNRYLQGSAARIKGCGWSVGPRHPLQPWRCGGTSNGGSGGGGCGGGSGGGSSSSSSIMPLVRACSVVMTARHGHVDHNATFSHTASLTVDTQRTRGDHGAALHGTPGTGASGDGGSASPGGARRLPTKANPCQGRGPSCFA